MNAPTQTQPHNPHLQPQSQPPVQVFVDSFDRLVENERQFLLGEIKSLPHSRVREAALIACVESMAKMCETELEKIISIDSRGELSIVALGSAGFAPREERKTFGEVFAGALTAAGVRTGAVEYGYGAVMDANASWCFMNHFSATKMVSDFYAAMVQAFLEVDDSSPDRPRSGG